MNKKLLLGLFIVLALVGGYFYFSKMKSGQSGNQTSSGVKSLQELITAGVPQKCTFSSTDESGSTQGTTYVAAGNVRSDFTTTISGETTSSHMISDGKTTYVWEDGESTGFKMTVEDSDYEYPNDDYSPDTPISAEADFDREADYDCSAWLPDNSVFTPPTDVNFTDFSQMYNPNTTPSGASGASGSQCSYCDPLTGDDKLKCLAAFNCN